MRKQSMLCYSIQIKSMNRRDYFVQSMPWTWIQFNAFAWRSQKCMIVDRIVVIWNEMDSKSEWKKHKGTFRVYLTKDEHKEIYWVSNTVLGWHALISHLTFSGH
jgi:hypothetical protein